MGIDLSEGGTGFNDLLRHYGHSVAISKYVHGDVVENVTIECETCHEVLVDFDAPREEENFVYECENCNEKFVDGDDSIGVGMIDDLFQRVEPGEIMPAGQCPYCRALVHLIGEEE